MRFLMLNWRDPMNPKSGGAERVSQAYLGALVERGHEVCWFANDFPGAEPAETVRGIKIVRGGGKGTSVMKAIRWYRRQAAVRPGHRPASRDSLVCALVVPDKLCCLHP